MLVLMVLLAPGGRGGHGCADTCLSVRLRPPGSELTPAAGLQQHRQCLHPHTLYLPVSQAVTGVGDDELRTLRTCSARRRGALARDSKWQ